MNKSRGFLRISLLFTAFGVVSLLSILSRSTLPKIRGVDVVHLIGTGMCFGFAIFSFAAYFHGDRFMKDKDSRQ